MVPIGVQVVGRFVAVVVLGVSFCCAQLDVDLTFTGWIGGCDQYSTRGKGGKGSGFSPLVVVS